VRSGGSAAVLDVLRNKYREIAMGHAALSSALCTQIESFAARIRRETGVPGIGVGVSIGGERFVVALGARARGAAEPLTTAARYRLGCITKLLLAALALELEHAGALDLRAPVGAYIAELHAAEHGRNVRVAHLLSHTSGYRGTNVLDPQTRVDSWEAFVTYLRSAPALFPAGSVFSCEHTESVLLAETILRATGEPGLSLVASRLLAPLGIAPHALAADDAGCHRFDGHSASFLPLDSRPALAPFWLPAFSRFSVTIADLLTIGEAVSGSAHAALLAPATRTALTTSVVRLPASVHGPLGELLPVAFALGTGELRDGSRGNTGLAAGQCVGLRFDARTGVCVAVALNAAAPHVRDFLLAALARELLGARTPPPSAPPVDLAALAGTYLGPGAGIVRARFEQGRLVCDIGREHRAETLRVELARSAAGALELRSPVPQLSLGFFTERETGARGLMLGLSAYRRVDG
jgi:CubicO group peptidase (beta-lactamase class C family)